MPAIYEYKHYVGPHGESWDLIGDGPFVRHFDCEDMESVWLLVTDEQVVQIRQSADLIPVMRYLDFGEPVIKIEVL